jgi:urea transporter
MGFLRAKLQALLERNVILKPFGIPTRTMPIVLLKNKNPLAFL